MNDTKKETTIALKKAQTSIKSILKMLEEDKYCIDILQQLLAVNGLIKSASNKMLENHLHTCFVDGLKTSNSANKNKLIKEVLQVVNLGSKK